MKIFCRSGRVNVALDAPSLQTEQMARKLEGSSVPPHAFVDDMPDVQTCFAGGVVGVRLARYSTTHLAREAIAVQYEGPRFFRNGTRECRLRFGRFEQVLSGLERAAVVVGQYLVAPLRCAVLALFWPTRIGCLPQRAIRRSPSHGPGSQENGRGVCPLHRLGLVCLAYQARLSLGFAAALSAARIFSPTAQATGGGKALPTCR